MQAGHKSPKDNNDETMDYNLFSLVVVVGMKHHKPFILQWDTHGPTCARPLHPAWSNCHVPFYDMESIHSRDWYQDIEGTMTIESLPRVRVFFFKSW